MIKFIKEKNVFILENKEITYLFFVNEKGILIHLYFGKKLNNYSLENFINQGSGWGDYYLEKETNLEKKYANSYYYDKSLVEFSSHGCGDTRSATLILEDYENNISDFRYLKHRIYKGRKELKNQPHCRLNKDDAETLEITLKDTTKNIRVILSYTILKDFPLILRNTTIINRNLKNIFIKKCNSITLDFARADFKLIHFPGDWALERQVYEEQITRGNKIISSNLGRSSHDHNPFIFLTDLDASETHGVVYGFSFVYSGNYKIDIGVNKFNSTRVNIGINDEDFSFKLESGECFDLPEGVILYSDSGIEKATHDLHDLIRNHLLRKGNQETSESILLNSWEGCYMDFDTAKILNYINEAHKIGATLFVLDDGWFGKRNDDSSSLGDWHVNEDKIDLKKVIDYAHSLNMKFGLWIEPEMGNFNSDLLRKHPDYALGNIKYNRPLSRHQIGLDFTNKEVREVIFNQISKILDTYEIDYVKVDNNSPIFTPTSSYLKNESAGSFYHKLTLGIYEFYDELTSRFTNILFEGCASGGGKFDLGMLYYFPQIWCSDETDPIQRLYIQYGTSYMYPLTSIGAHVSKNPIISYKDKSAVALFGTYGYEFDPQKLTDKEKEELNEFKYFYKKYHQKVIVEGDFYRLNNPFTSNYFGAVSVSKDKTIALALFVNFKKENDCYRFLKVRGLAKNKMYKNSFNNLIASGEYYENVGVNISIWLDEFRSILIEFDEVIK